MNATTYETFIKHAALAFFASAYADLCEEFGQPLSGEIMDQLPEPIDPEAIKAAEDLLSSLIGNNYPAYEAYYTVPGAPPCLDRLWTAVQAIVEERGGGDRHLTVEMFGHYAAMQAMGHGVGLHDAFGGEVYDRIKVPHVEFSSCSLSSNYGLFHVYEVTPSQPRVGEDVVLWVIAECVDDVKAAYPDALQIEQIDAVLEDTDDAIDADLRRNLSTFTVFCQGADGTGTTWIDSVQAYTPEAVKILGRRKCAADWGREDEDDVHVLGVAKGDVEIVFWEDVDS